MKSALSKSRRNSILFLLMCFASVITGGYVVLNNVKQIKDDAHLMSLANEQLTLLERNSKNILQIIADENKDSFNLLKPFIIENIDKITENHQILKANAYNSKKVVQLLIVGDSLLNLLEIAKSQLILTQSYDFDLFTTLLDLQERMVIHKSNVIATFQIDDQRKQQELKESIYYTGVWVMCIIFLGLVFSIAPFVSRIQEEKEYISSLNRRLEKQLTETEKIKEKLEVSEQMYRMMSETSTDLISLHNERGQFVFASEAANNLLGFNSEELLGSSLVNLVHDDDQELMEQFLLSKEPSGNIQYRITNKDGHFIWFESAAKTQFNEDRSLKFIQLSSRDVSKSVEDRQAIDISEKRFKSLASNAPIGIFQADANGNLTFVNQQWCNIIECDPYGILGQHWIKVFHCQEKNSLIDFWEKVSNGTQIPDLITDLRIKTQSSIVKWVHVRITAEVDFNDRFNGVFGIFSDITDRKNNEQKLHEAKERAELATKTKAAFLSTMSHEIRTPLNAVIGISHLLLDETPTPSQKKYLDTLLFSSQNLLGLINDVLDFNKMEAGNIDLINADFNLIELIEGIQHTFEMKAKEKGIQFTIDTAANLPEFIFADATRITQVLNNLLANAVKFTNDGSVRLSLKLKDRKTDQAIIYGQISDTGIGISKDSLPHIFDVFSSATGNTTRKFGGTGLGLSITKRLIEHMGGYITVDSAMGEGTTFKFTLPIAISSEEAVISLKNKTENQASRLKGKILLVEDNEVNYFVVDKFLHKWGLELDWAASGDEALKLVQQEEYDLILMDIQMPEMDGYEATKALKKLNDGAYANVPVLAITASVFLDVKDKMEESGMIDMIPKPFDPNELYRKIAQYLSQSTATLDPKPEMKMESEKSSFAKKISLLTEGDIGFTIELLDVYGNNFQNMKIDYRQAIENKDEEALKFVMHKHKSAIELLKLEKLRHLTNDAKVLMNTNVKKSIKTHLLAVELEIDKIIDQIVLEKQELAIL